MSFASEFREFAIKGSVVDLAVGVRPLVQLLLGATDRRQRDGRNDEQNGADSSQLM